MIVPNTEHVLYEGSFSLEEIKKVETISNESFTRIRSTIKYSDFIAYNSTTSEVMPNKTFDVNATDIRYYYLNFHNWLLCQYLY